MIKQEKSLIKHMIECVEFWLERVKTQEELLAEELVIETTREEITADLARYTNNLYDTTSKLKKVVCDVE